MPNLDRWSARSQVTLTHRRLLLCLILGLYNNMFSSVAGIYGLAWFETDAWMSAFPQCVQCSSFISCDHDSSIIKDTTDCRALSFMNTIAISMGLSTPLQHQMLSNLLKPSVSCVILHHFIILSIILRAYGLGRRTQRTLTSHMRRPILWCVRLLAVVQFCICWRRFEFTLRVHPFHPINAAPGRMNSW